MKHTITLLALLLASAGALAAQGLLETTEEARQRQNAERYETYRQRGSQAPLGGYQDKLGSPAPYGTQRPGYTSPYSNPYGAPQETWRDRLNR